MEFIAENNTEAELNGVLSSDKNGDININGHFLLEYAVVAKENNVSYYYVPVVADDWNTQKPISIIAKFPTTDFESLRMATEDNSANGVIHKRLLDKGLSKDIIDKFSQMNLTINSDKYIVIDISGKKQFSLLWLFIVDIIVIVFLTALGIKFNKNN